MGRFELITVLSQSTQGSHKGRKEKKGQKKVTSFVADKKEELRIGYSHEN